MALTQFGEKTESVFLKAIEANKLHHEFEVKAGASVVKGQLVKMAADGTIEPAAIGELNYLVIGIALHTRAAGELVTVGMKAFTIVWSQTAGALAAGPVKVVAAAPTKPLYRSYAAVVLGAAPLDAGADTVGICLDQAAGVDELVRVAIL
jgi:hypothetical protein